MNKHQINGAVAGTVHAAAPSPHADMAQQDLALQPQFENRVEKWLAEARQIIQQANQAAFEAAQRETK